MAATASASGIRWDSSVNSIWFGRIIRDTTDASHRRPFKIGRRMRGRRSAAGAPATRQGIAS
jgi:hypothetical protein